MSFVLLKLAWWLLKPSSLVLLILIGITVLLWQRRVRSATILATVLSGFLIINAVFDLPFYLAQPLENRFGSPDIPATLAGLIVLGGSVHQPITAARSQLSLGESAERLTEGLALHRQYPDVPIIFSGGSGRLTPQQFSEAEIAGQFFMTHGVIPEQLILEDQSRNTLENALMTRELVEPQPDQVYLLITSAMHLPRAQAAFSDAGWQVVPYPVDYQTTLSPEPSLAVIEQLNSLDHVAREWLALIYYQLQRRWL
jgi:uncharacterized SAM-binding protein YcdF (DUF218 family)